MKHLDFNLTDEKEECLENSIVKLAELTNNELLISINKKIKIYNMEEV